MKIQVGKTTVITSLYEAIDEQRVIDSVVYSDHDDEHIHNSSGGTLERKH